MVRLLPEEAAIRRAERRNFQSHNGAIAAPTLNEMVFGVDCFQSHNGAIAAFIRIPKHCTHSVFQSHNGAIAAPQNLVAL